MPATWCAHTQCGRSRCVTSGPFLTDRLCVPQHSLNPNASLSDWQSRGHEHGTKVADPMFVDAASNNFNLKEGSPALALGFEPLDLTHGVGPDW